MKETNPDVQKLRTKDGYEKINKVIYHEGLSLVLEAIQTEIISRQHDDLLAGYFGIKKTCKLVAQTYYWLIFCHDVKVYVKSCDVCLALKIVRDKPYGNFYHLMIPIY